MQQIYSHCGVWCVEISVYSLVCLFVQRSAEDQPNEQEEGGWQPGTLTTLTLWLYFMLRTFYRLWCRDSLSLSYRNTIPD